MTKMHLVMTTAAMAFALTALAGASQAAVTHHKVKTVDSHVPGQISREHARAVAAGDAANDPLNSASSDTLNQQQLSGTPAPAGGMTTAPADASGQPAAGSTNTTNTSAVDSTAPSATPSTSDSGMSSTADATLPSSAGSDVTATAPSSQTNGDQPATSPTGTTTPPATTPGTTTPSGN